MGLVAGVVALNVVFTAVGFSALFPALRGRSARVWASYAGVALLVGAAAVGVGLCIAAPMGVRIGLPAFATVAGLVAVGGLAVGRFVPPRALDRIRARPPAAAQPARIVEDVVVTVAAFGIVAVLVMALVGGFRTAAWLDDTWYFWLPKGRALDLVGLDPRLWGSDPSLHMVFGNSGETLQFIRPDNPLWWSILLNLDMRFVGSVDMRAVDGQLAFLLIGFIAAGARLLWGHVRTWVLLPALLVILSAPELLRQAQSGEADIPLAIYLALGLLAAAGWLAHRSGFALALFFVFSSATIAIKSEGVLELLLYLVILSVALWRWRRGILPLWITAGAAVATSVPWFAWRYAHGVSNVFSLRDAFSPSYLGEHTDRLRDALRILGEDVASIRKWSLLVPLAVVLGIVGLARERAPSYLAPAALLAVGYLFFVWISWADPEGAFRLVASGYRYVTAPILVVGIFLPVVAERLLRR